MIEFGLFVMLVLGLLVVGLLVLGVVVVTTLVKLVFRLLGAVLRVVFWPVRAVMSSGGDSGSAGHRCPRPSCSQCNPVEARFCGRCGRALVYAPERHDTCPPVSAVATPSGWAHR